MVVSERTKPVVVVDAIVLWSSLPVVRPAWFWLSMVQPHDPVRPGRRCVCGQDAGVSCGHKARTCWQPGRRWVGGQDADVSAVRTQMCRWPRHRCVGDQDADVVSVAITLGRDTHAAQRAKVDRGWCALPGGQDADNVCCGPSTWPRHTCVHSAQRLTEVGARCLWLGSRWETAHRGCQWLV